MKVLNSFVLLTSLFLTAVMGVQLPPYELLLRKKSSPYTLKSFKELPQILFGPKSSPHTLESFKQLLGGQEQKWAEDFWHEVALPYKGEVRSRASSKRQARPALLTKRFPVLPLSGL